jgi:hypothetical protein
MSTLPFQVWTRNELHRPAIKALLAGKHAAPSKRSLFLRMCPLTVLVELRLNRFLILFAIRSMACTLRPEDDARTRATTGFHRNVAEPFRNADRRLFHLRLAFFDFPASSSLALGSFSRRTNESPRFSSAVRSVFSVATCTGLPDSFPSQALSSSGVVSTYRPCRRTGIPSDAQRWTTDAGSPKKAAICCQPVSVSGRVSGASCFFARCGMICSQPNNRPCGGGSNSTGLAHSASSFSTWLTLQLTA